MNTTTPQHSDDARHDGHRTSPIEMRPYALRVDPAPRGAPIGRRGLARLALAGSAALALALSGCAGLSGGPARSSGVNSVPLDAFMQRVERDVQAGIIPGAVLLVRGNGQVLYRKAVASAIRRRPMRCRRTPCSASIR